MLFWKLISEFSVSGLLLCRSNAITVILCIAIIINFHVKKKMKMARKCSTHQNWILQNPSRLSERIASAKNVFENHTLKWNSIRREEKCLIPIENGIVQCQWICQRFYPNWIRKKKNEKNSSLQIDFLCHIANTRLITDWIQNRDNQTENRKSRIQLIGVSIRDDKSI